MSHYFVSDPLEDVVVTDGTKEGNYEMVVHINLQLLRSCRMVTRSL